MTAEDGRDELSLDQSLGNPMKLRQEGFHSQTEDRLLNILFDFPQAVHFLFMRGVQLDQDVFQVEKINFFHFLCFLIELTKPWGILSWLRTLQVIHDTLVLSEPEGHLFDCTKLLKVGAFATMLERASRTLLVNCPLVLCEIQLQESLRNLQLS